MAVRTVEELKTRMRALMKKWHVGTRQGNDGDAGNTLEDLLEIAENNFRLPDFGEIEIKTKKFEGKSGLLTLFHKEPSPGASVPKLLKSMGWRHEKAGTAPGYPVDEMRFSSTTYGNYYTDRGYSVRIEDGKIKFVYDPTKVNRACADRTAAYSGYANYGAWADAIELRNPSYKTVMPVYYDIEEVKAAFVTKLSHTLLALRKTRTVGGLKEYWYEEAYLMKEVKTDMIIPLLQDGSMAVDFDARTHHNHGTKFRIKKDQAERLFTEYAAMD